MGRGEGSGGVVRPRKEGAQRGESWSLAGPEDERPRQRAPPGPPGAGAEAPQDKCEPAARTSTGVLQLDGAGKAYLMKELCKRLLER